MYVAERDPGRRWRRGEVLGERRDEGFDVVIYQIDPSARSRLVGAYMVFYSIGSAGGAISSTFVYARAGWTGVCVLGAAISGSALALWAIAERAEVLGRVMKPQLRR
jgi:MFS family permease